MTLEEEAAKPTGFEPQDDKHTMDMTREYNGDGNYVNMITSQTISTKKPAPTIPRVLEEDSQSVLPANTKKQLSRPKPTTTYTSLVFFSLLYFDFISIFFLQF